MAIYKDDGLILILLLVTMSCWAAVNYLVLPQDTHLYAKYFVSNGFATFEHAFVDIRTHFSMALQFFGLASIYMIHFLKINK